MPRPESCWRIASRVPSTTEAKSLGRRKVFNFDTGFSFEARLGDENSHFVFGRPRQSRRRKQHQYAGISDLEIFSLEPSSGTNLIRESVRNWSNSILNCDRSACFTAKHNSRIHRWLLSKLHLRRGFDIDERGRTGSGRNGRTGGSDSRRHSKLGLRAVKHIPAATTGQSARAPCTHWSVNPAKWASVGETAT
jgi:hypothetical protein